MSPGTEAKQRLIDRFELIPHPEGGHYRETHRDSVRVARLLGPATPGNETGSIARSASTCIYYMLCDGAYSAWHRIRSDEVWHFYAGDPLDVHVIDAAGRLVTHRLGNALVDNDAAFQVIVPSGCWFSAECSSRAADAEASGFAFVGCTVAPGFEFSDFELADVDTLAATYPNHAAIIRRLAPRPSDGINKT